MDVDTSPPSKRTKVDLLVSLNEENNDEGSPEQEHCTICLQPFLDRAIIPVCAHEFCFECILLWSEQSRKCPLCSRSFDNSYLIHHVRSQYDYQKHYLPPSRSSPPPLLTGESHANALRHTRRERQWGRRQRQQREEADRLEIAIARRRWIYQHHLYAKHVASNPYTRYRPFPTPAQFAASPDLISRMTIFLRRELHVWPNLDVEFLTTYTISLMKSIDIRSESAVKLLSEFLDLDTPYAAGERHVNAEHFAHEIYSYLRSPYRDLFVYDQTAQYDTPPEISPPHEIARGNRWSVEPSPPRRSRSRSRSNPPLAPHRENGPAPAIYPRENTIADRREARPSHRLNNNHSTQRINPPADHDDPRNRSDGVDHILRNPHLCTGEITYPETSGSTALGENQDTGSPVRSHPRNDGKGKGREMRGPVSEMVSKFGAPGGDGSATTLVMVESDNEADYVDQLGGGSSANPRASRKRPDVHIHPRNRTLSGSVQAYLSKPAAPRNPPTKKSKPFVSELEQGERPETDTAGMSATNARPASLLLRLSDDLSGPDIGNLSVFRKAPTIANGDKVRIRISDSQRCG